MTKSPRLDHDLLLAALGQTAGPTLVLDRALRIAFGAGEVEALLGGVVPVGKRATQVLCGESERRPVAEALARGESASTEIVRSTEGADQSIAVKTVPLVVRGSLIGHLIFLSPSGSMDEAGLESHGIVTRSESMRSLLRIVEKVARSDASVLVRGETGAGKELIARALHRMSPRRDKPFAAINCAALPAELLESELFGHVRGAFTGAVRDHDGHFRAAHGGTLFLDEVAELPLTMQAKLLRVTQERSVLPVGGDRPIPVDVRLISATHRSLRSEVAAGRFRADLMYRLRVIPLFLPALRERPEDIELLAWRTLNRLNVRSPGRRVSQLAPTALETLRAYSWPGNVRELENVLEYAFLFGDGPVLSESELPAELRGDTLPPVRQPPEARQHTSREGRRIVSALERAAGNRSRAASSLGISRSTLWRKMQKYGIDG